MPKKERKTRLVPDGLLKRSLEDVKAAHKRAKKDMIATGLFNEEFIHSEDKTGVFDGIVFVKGICFGNVKTLEQEQRLKAIFKLKENKAVSYLEISEDWSEQNDNSVLQWKNRINAGLFTGFEVIAKDGPRMYWTAKNIEVSE